MINPVHEMIIIITDTIKMTGIKKVTIITIGGFVIGMEVIMETRFTTVGREGIEGDLILNKKRNGIILKIKVRREIKKMEGEIIENRKEILKVNKLSLIHLHIYIYIYIYVYRLIL